VKAGDLEFAMRIKLGESMIMQLDQTTTVTSSKLTNLEFANQMQGRTKSFAIRIVRMFQRLPKTDEARILGRHVLRAGTAIASNYRAACRSKSRADFVSKLGTAVEEADETVFWAELLEESGIFRTKELQEIKTEAEELLRIFSRSLTTAKRGR
jgi:four helix bundle protein